MGNRVRRARKRYSIDRQRCILGCLRAGEGGGCASRRVVGEPLTDHRCRSSESGIRANAVARTSRLIRAIVDNAGGDASLRPRWGGQLGQGAAAESLIGVAVVDPAVKVVTPSVVV